MHVSDDDKIRILFAPPNYLLYLNIITILGSGTHDAPGKSEDCAVEGTCSKKFGSGLHQSAHTFKVTILQSQKLPVTFL